MADPTFVDGRFLTAKYEKASPGWSLFEITTKCILNTLLNSGLSYQTKIIKPLRPPFRRCPYHMSVHRPSHGVAWPMFKKIPISYLLPLLKVLLEHSPKYRVIAEHRAIHDNNSIWI